MKETILKNLRQWCLITVASLFYAASIAMFLNPNELAPGGLSGIAIIINHLSDLPVGLMFVLMNIPLLLIGCIAIGRGFLLKTIYAVAVSSLAMDLMPKWLPSLCPVTSDKLLAAVVGAALSAVGIGLIFRCGGSTGGTDIIVKLLRRKFRNLRTGGIVVIVDSLVVIASAIAFQNIENALYAWITLFLTGKIMDVVLYGTDGAMLLIIISDRYEVLAKRLMADADAGVTFAEGSGAYTGAAKRIIFCVVKKHLFHKAKDLVKSEDPAAFLIVTNASEIFGEGYKAHGAEEL